MRSGISKIKTSVCQRNHPLNTGINTPLGTTAVLVHHWITNSHPVSLWPFVWIIDKLPYRPSKTNWPVCINGCWHCCLCLWIQTCVFAVCLITLLGNRQTSLPKTWNECPSFYSAPAPTWHDPCFCYAIYFFLCTTDCPHTFGLRLFLMVWLSPSVPIKRKSLC